MHLISPTNDMIINWGVHKAYHCYYGLYAERQYVTFLSYTGLRNQGIFCEGPMHSLCLTIAIAMEIFAVEPFYRDKNHTIYSSGHVGKKLFRRRMNGKLLILIATLISTFTTTGQIIIIVMLILRIMLGSSQHRFNKLMKLFVVVLFAILGMYVATSILLMKATSESWLIRMNGYRTGLQAWLKAPLFGTGFNDYTVLRTLSSNFGASNSITLILAQGGIMLLMIYLIPVVAAGWLAIKSRDNSMLSFLLVFICEFTVTAFSYEFLMLFLLSYFYSSFIRINVHPSSIPKLQRE